MKRNMMIASVALFVVAVIGGKMYAGNVAEEEINKAIASVHAEKVVKYDSVSVGLLGGITLKSVEIGEHGELKADAVQVASLDRAALNGGEFPSYGDIRIKGFELAVSDREMSRSFPLLYKMGYRDVRGDLSVKYSYSVDDKKLLIDAASLTLDGAGTLVFDLEVEVPLGSVNNPLLLLAGLNRAKLTSASLTMKNDGLVDHMLAAAKHEDGLSKDAALEQLDKQASHSSNAIQKELLIAVRNFLDGGDEFKASIKPSSPVAMTGVINAIQSGNFEHLNISVTGS